LAITSFTFMLVWVPEPVCQTLSGNSSSAAARRDVRRRGGDRLRERWRQQPELFVG